MTNLDLALLGLTSAMDHTETKAPRLLGGVTMGAPEHHRMCRWGADHRIAARAPQIMETNAIGMLRHTAETWFAELAMPFLKSLTGLVKSSTA